MRLRVVNRKSNKKSNYKKNKKSNYKKNKKSNYKKNKKSNYKKNKKSNLRNKIIRGGASARPSDYIFKIGAKVHTIGGKSGWLVNLSFCQEWLASQPLTNTCKKTIYQVWQSSGGGSGKNIYNVSNPGNKDLYINNNEFHNLYISTIKQVETGIDVDGGKCAQLSERQAYGLEPLPLGYGDPFHPLESLADPVVKQQTHMKQKELELLITWYNTTVPLWFDKAQQRPEEPSGSDNYIYFWKKVNYTKMNSFIQIFTGGRWQKVKIIGTPPQFPINVIGKHKIQSLDASGRVVEVDLDNHKRMGGDWAPVTETHPTTGKVTYAQRATWANCDGMGGPFFFDAFADKTHKDRIETVIRESRKYRPNLSIPGQKGRGFSRTARLFGGPAAELYHMTNKNSVLLILRSGEMQSGTEGMLGGGIYFGIPSEIYHKAHQRDASALIVKANVYFGNILTVVFKSHWADFVARGMDAAYKKHLEDKCNNPSWLNWQWAENVYGGHRNITFERLQSGDYGDVFDSVQVLGRNGEEWVVYNSDQVEIRGTYPRGGQGNTVWKAKGTYKIPDYTNRRLVAQPTWEKFGTLNAKKIKDTGL